MTRFTITDTKIRISDNSGSKMAVVVCLEDIETTAANRQVIKIGIIATNIFERNEQQNQQRLLVHHHGSPVTNYISPNVSSQ